MLVRGVEDLKTAFWHDSGSSRRSSPVDPWRWNPEKDVLACFRVFKGVLQRGRSLNGNAP
eukprot:7342272-Pyramimonas_sp.AAC.1